MHRFRCVPVPTATAKRFRETGRDDRGNTLRHMLADAPAGYPCRHCLRLARPGEPVLLGSYDLPAPLGIYWTPSPIFLHADPCPAFDEPGTLAPTVRANPLVSIRAYDAADQCLYDLGHVTPGDAAEPALARALADRRTAFVNIHTARPGCLLTRVERAT